MRTGCLLSLLILITACSDPTASASDPMPAFMNGGSDKDMDGVKNGMDLCDGHGTTTDPALVNEWGCTIPQLELQTDYIEVDLGASATPVVHITDAYLQPISDWAPSLQNWTVLSNPPSECLTGAEGSYAALRPSAFCGGPTAVSVEVFEKIKKGQLSAEIETITINVRTPDLFIQATNVDDRIEVAFNGETIFDASSPTSAHPGRLMRAGFNKVTWYVYNESPGAGWTWALFVSVDGVIILDETCGMPGAGCKDQSQGLVLTGRCSFFYGDGAVSMKECAWDF